MRNATLAIGMAVALVTGQLPAETQVIGIRAGCRRAKEPGGTVVPGFPFNRPDGTGAIDLVVDPAGYPVGLYSSLTILADCPRCQA